MDNGPHYEWMDDVKTVVIKKGVTSIGDEAFRGCKNLSNITIPGSVTEIGEHAFCLVSLVSSEFILHCNPGSYAEEYAKNHYIEYEYIK